MNLFVTHPDPIVAARQLDDKRVHKIALEAALVLSVALLERGVDGFYRPTHVGHPVTRWVCAEPCNAAWTLRYGLELCEVYKLYGRKPQVKHEDVLRRMKRHIRYTGREPSWFQNSARRESLGLDFTHLPVHRAYREYLCARWPDDKRPVVWTGRPRPRWARFYQGEEV